MVLYNKNQIGGYRLTIQESADLHNISYDEESN